MPFENETSESYDKVEKLLIQRAYLQETVKIEFRFPPKI